MSVLTAGAGSGTIGVRWMYAGRVLGEPKNQISYVIASKAPSADAVVEGCANEQQAFADLSHKTNAREYALLFGDTKRSSIFACPGDDGTELSKRIDTSI